MVRAWLRLTLCLLSVGATLSAQQLADEQFDPPIPQPAYAQGKGAVVAIDEAHFNFHTLSGRFQAFAKLLGKDGYRQQANLL